MTTPAAPCPLCGQEADQEYMISVCSACHVSVQGGEPIVVRTTGEFHVDDIMRAAAEHVAEPAPVRAASDGTVVQCTWCSKSGSEVKKVLSRGDAHICNECVALCADIMHAELGDHWR